jgi:hypothetical protein
MPIGLDGRGVISKQFQVRTIPQTIIVDRMGIVTHVFLGSSRSAEQGFERALGEVVGKSTER